MSVERRDTTTPGPPAFYAQPRFLRGERVRQWWTLLHPPYTLWHLSYVVIGACMMTPVNATRLVITVVAFFLAVGLGAHALDELHDRPLATTIPRAQLIAVAGLGVGGAVALGIAGMWVVSAYLALFIFAGVVLALGYNLELANGRLHSDLVFALSWGAFPVLTAGFAQHGRLNWPLAGAAVFAALLSQAQRQLSTPARQLRRRTTHVDGQIVSTNGNVVPVTATTILGPLERALRSLGWCVVVLAITMVLVRFQP